MVYIILYYKYIQCLPVNVHRSTILMNTKHMR